MKKVKKYLLPRGRDTRKEFWLIFVGGLIALVGSFFALAQLGIILDAPYSSFIAWWLVVVLIVSVLILFSMARRFHDVDWSGWWVLALFIPILGFLIFIVLLLPTRKGSLQPKEKSVKKDIVVIMGILWVALVVFGFVAGVMESSSIINDLENSQGADIGSDIKITQNGNITNLETAGNLKVTHKLKCISPQDIKSEYTPADLMPAVVDCIDSAKYENAVVLFSMASLYGRFDMERVKDDTAHQAISALIANHLQFMDTPNKKEFNKFITDVMRRMENSDDKLDLKKRVCEGILNVPMPTYFPSYMIYHGMDAFSPDFDVKDGIKNIQTPKQFWDKILKERFGGCF